jgi:branched-subunit amino acid transport protein
MTVLLAVGVVGLGSLMLRLTPILGSERLPEGVARAAGHAGLAVLAALVVRSVVTHQDPSLTGPVAAPLVAAVAVGVGLLLAHRGRSVLTTLAVGAATYLSLSWAVAALTT